MSREYPCGIRGHSAFRRELGARPGNGTHYAPSLSQDSLTPLDTSNVSLESTLSPTISHEPSNPPVLATPPSTVWPRVSTANPSAAPSTIQSPSGSTLNPLMQSLIPSPSFPPVGVQMPTSNQVPDELFYPTADNENPVVAVDAVDSRSGGPRDMLSAATITGVVLGFSGLCLMGFASSRRRKNAELMDSASDEASS